MKARHTTTKPSDDSASAVAILKAELKVHDLAALDLMRSAKKHLRAGSRLAREISNLEREAAHAA